MHLETYAKQHRFPDLFLHFYRHFKRGKNTLGFFLLSQQREIFALKWKFHKWNMCNDLMSFQLYSRSTYDFRSAVYVCVCCYFQHFPHLFRNETSRLKSVNRCLFLIQLTRSFLSVFLFSFHRFLFVCTNLQKKNGVASVSALTHISCPRVQILVISHSSQSPSRAVVIFVLVCL